MRVSSVNLATLWSTNAPSGGVYKYLRTILARVRLHSLIFATLFSFINIYLLNNGPHFIPEALSLKLRIHITPPFGCNPSIRLSCRFYPQNVSYGCTNKFSSHCKWFICCFLYFYFIIIFRFAVESIIIVFILKVASF